MVIITLSGLPGSGKSSLGRMLAARLGIPLFSIGSIRRAYAIEHGLSLEGLNRHDVDIIQQNHPSQEQDARQRKDDPASLITESDRIADGYLARLPEKYPSFIADANMGFHFLPQSIKIFLLVDRSVAAQRIMAAKREDEHWSTIEQGIKTLEERFLLDHERYLRLYGVDYADTTQYDFVLDASNNTLEELLEKILDFLRSKGAINNSTSSEA